MLAVFLRALKTVPAVACLASRAIPHQFTVIDSQFIHNVHTQITKKEMLNSDSYNFLWVQKKQSFEQQ